MREQNHSSWRAVLTFAGHALAGAAIFVILALLAVGLGKFVHLLEQWGASETMVTCLTALEYVIFAADAISLMLFLWNAIRAALKEMNS
ncbi:hypothetical protein [Ralstonia mannitolilytica]|jgi:hypothetical protein|uniref:hypothetical protein n=1 Tax=Ralstonia mannitolilytica TaxID=105219 RepID=UPI000E0E2BEC|nr:hypothetical protein [Ralstonia mannitolilytica]